ncbi:DinB family protein [Sungkyunkwania multivorans]|uniref:DinB family protein n=1 Tax=Sungkyunkwania multivorans TaxID=1173618 RepID=A0ABW3CW74_9FLAO
MTTKDLQPNEFHEYYGRYIDKVDDNCPLIEAFENGKANVTDFFGTIPKAKQQFRYATDKWSIKEVFQHLIDTERIFMYRCFRIARNDKTPLAGFDQNVYIAPSAADQKSMYALLAEFEAVRDHSISLLKSLSEDDLASIGNSNGSPMSGRAAAFVIPGHEIWHMDVVKEKYL